MPDGDVDEFQQLREGKVELMPGMSDQHSGNTFGGALRLGGALLLGRSV